MTKNIRSKKGGSFLNFFLGKSKRRSKNKPKNKLKNKLKNKSEKKPKKTPSDCPPDKLRCPMCAYHYPNIKKCPHCKGITWGKVQVKGGGNRRRTYKRR